MKSKKVIISILIFIAVVICVLLLRVLFYPFNYNYASNDQANVMKPAITDEALQHFAGGIRIPTISNENYEETNFGPFKQFMTYLSETYPTVYKTMQVDTVNQYSLVFHWKGKNKDLKPILFLSHYDVVPVVGFDPETEPASPIIFEPNSKPLPPITTYAEKWSYPPFSGAVINGRVYGRGTLDMKCMLFSLFEGANDLIKADYQPERDIWFAFGHDEEVSGRQGAVKIADYLKSKGLEFDAVYDEGGIIAAPGSAMESIQKPLGLVGVGEKGFLTLRLKVKGLGGHSSMPPAKSSLVYAAEIIEKLNSDQLPSKIIAPIEDFLGNIGNEMGFASKLAIANQWLLKPLLLNTLEKSPASNALVRTTTAITMAKGSDAPNVLSSISEVTVNFRILPTGSIQQVMDHVNGICKDYDVEIETISAREPSSISPTDVEGFDIIKKNVAQLYPSAIVSAYITIGGTDAYKYQIVSNNIYRFLPMELNTYEQRTIHNEDEYISIENFSRMIWYFKEIMKTY